MIETVKEHPYLTVGVVVGVGILVYMLSGSSGGAPASGYAGGPVDAAMAAQNAQLQASSTASQLATAAQVRMSEIAATKDIAELQGRYSLNNNEIAAGVRYAEIDAAERYQSLATTLDARVKSDQVAAAVENSRIQSTTALQNQRILADALITQSNNQTAVSLGYVNAARDVQTQSWIDKIFG